MITREIVHFLDIFLILVT